MVQMCAFTTIHQLTFALLAAHLGCLHSTDIRTWQAGQKRYLVDDAVGKTYKSEVWAMSRGGSRIGQPSGQGSRTSEGLRLKDLYFLCMNASRASWAVAWRSDEGRLQRLFAAISPQTLCHVPSSQRRCLSDKITGPSKELVVLRNIKEV